MGICVMVVEVIKYDLISWWVKILDYSFNLVIIFSL